MADHVLSTDELYPRCADERYRLYVRRGDDELEILATAADMSSIGLAIGTIHDDCKQAGLRLDDLGVIGILDTLAHDPVITTGEWVVTPWERRTT